VKVQRKATLSFYEGGVHRTEGYGDTRDASIQESLSLFSFMLRDIMADGAKAGDKLKITIETVK
jgi:hypothetical protein